MRRLATPRSCGRRRVNPRGCLRAEQHGCEYAHRLVFKNSDARHPGDAFAEVGQQDPTWGAAPITFPRVQGADVRGRIVAVGGGVDVARIGERIITDNWLRDPLDPADINKTGDFGSDHDGGFAQYTTIPAQNAIAINSDLTDAELATFSCSYSTAEGMLMRASVTPRDTVLLPGASGSLGGALGAIGQAQGRTGDCHGA